MYKSVLEISPEGYNVEQTNFYINNLLNKISFIDSAYNDSLERIKALESQNELLIKNNNMLNEILTKLNAVAEQLGIVFENTVSEESIPFETAEINYEEITDVIEETTIEPEFEKQNADLSFLRDEINSLKSIFNDN